MLEGNRDPEQLRLNLLALFMVDLYALEIEFRVLDFTEELSRTCLAWICHHVLPLQIKHWRMALLDLSLDKLCSSLTLF